MQIDGFSEHETKIVMAAAVYALSNPDQAELVRLDCETDKVIVETVWEKLLEVMP